MQKMPPAIFTGTVFGLLQSFGLDVPPGMSGPNQSLAGRGPTGLWARLRNRGRLENQSHVVPKTGFQDGGDRTLIFTHKIIILA